ncbi:MAG: tryptophan-rich sensory protein [Oscillibacter sp.]|nr:tryptophan-rich sensory protein [Oscillibacter sp.]
MKRKWSTLLVCLAVPLATGGLAALLTRDAMERFSSLNQPPLSPPAWLFPVVWTILYLLMGIASYLVFREPRSERPREALWLYGAQLVFNFLWSIVFFNLGWYLFAFLWLVCLWALILLTIGSFRRVSRTAARLLLPYLLWVTFAGYLNLGVWILNA